MEQFATGADEYEGHGKLISHSSDTSVLTGPEIHALKREAYATHGWNGPPFRPHPEGERPPWAFTYDGRPWTETWYVPGGWTRITPSGLGPDDHDCAEQVAWHSLHCAYEEAATPDFAARVALGNNGPRLCTPPGAPRQLLRACDHTKCACWIDRSRAEGDRQIVYRSGEDGPSIVLAWAGFERADDGVFKPAGVSRSCTTTRDTDITAWADAAAAWLLHGAVTR